VQSRIVAWAVFVLVLPFGASAQSAFDTRALLMSVAGQLALIK
jgi:hypothetical protein